MGIAPVFWLPGVSIAAVDAIKTSIFVIGAGLFFFRLWANSKVYLPRGLWGPVGFMGLIILSLPGFVQSTGNFITLQSIYHIILPFLFLWCFFNLTLYVADLRPIFRRAAIIISLFSAIHVVNYFTGMPDFRAPYPDPFTTIGFGAAATGWSNGLALYLSIMIILTMSKSDENSYLHKIIWIALAACITGSQIASEGRAGILTSFLILTMSTFLFPKRQFFVLVCCAVSIALIALIYLILNHDLTIDVFLMTDSFKLNRLISMDVFDLDHFSSGRIEQYIYAIEKILQRSLFGHGVGTALVFKSNEGLLEIHNHWLRMMVEYGISQPLFFAAMIGVAVYHAARLFSKPNTTAMNRELAIQSFLVVIAGVFLSFLEPRIFVGSFQNGAIWWSSIGVILGLRSRSKISQRYSPREDAGSASASGGGLKTPLRRVGAAST